MRSKTQQWWDPDRLDVVAEDTTKIAIAYWETKMTVAEVAKMFDTLPRKLTHDGLVGLGRLRGRTCWNCGGPLVIRNRSVAAFSEADRPLLAPACAKCSPYGWRPIESLPPDRRAIYRAGWLVRHPNKFDAYDKFDAYQAEQERRAQVERRVRAELELEDSRNPHRRTT